MLFTSYGFIAFLAAVLLLYYIVPKKTQWMLLLAASYFFYAFSGLWNFAFIISVTVSCYVIARIIERMKNREDIAVEQNRDIWSKDERKLYRAKSKKRRLWVLILGVIINIGILAVIKYTAFAITNVNSVLSLFGAEKLTSYFGAILKDELGLQDTSSDAELSAFWQGKLEIYNERKNKG